ncbi:hypothetical protein EVAR_86735_1 [Eumeta japonica]|uniref:Uncharacterized protein n=1 Tax=Eumeta variegata TaxID=151549 RepID=A0A4C1W0C4_EUMVA|nr:hypothetical protein EVAR_86735_1 [Eumeta japonica]
MPPDGADELPLNFIEVAELRLDGVETLTSPAALKPGPLQGNSDRTDCSGRGARHTFNARPLSWLLKEASSTQAEIGGRARAPAAGRDHGADNNYLTLTEKEVAQKGDSNKRTRAGRGRARSARPTRAAISARRHPEPDTAQLNFGFSR